MLNSNCDLYICTYIYIYNCQILSSWFFCIPHINFHNLFVPSFSLGRKYLFHALGIPMAFHLRLRIFLFHIKYFINYVNLHIQPSIIRLLKFFVAQLVWSIYLQWFTFFIYFLLKLPTPNLVHVSHNTYKFLCPLVFVFCHPISYISIINIIL